MNAKSTVAISLLWLGLLVVLSRKWVGDIRTSVRTFAGQDPNT